jgi:hypothetical protein
MAGYSDGLLVIPANPEIRRTTTAHLVTDDWLLLKQRPKSSYIAAERLRRRLQPIVQPLRHPADRAGSNRLQKQIRALSGRVRPTRFINGRCR